VSSLGFIRIRVAALPRCTLVVLALVSFAAGGLGAETGLPAAVAGRADETNTQDTPGAHLQLQEPLHATQLAIERIRKQADAAAAQNAKAFTSRLQGIEQALTLQREQELAAMQSSNWAILFVAGLFAALGFLAMLFMSYFQWRTINRLAEDAAASPVVQALDSGPPLAALGAGDAPVKTVGPVRQSNRRLLGARERLGKRIYQLEHTPNPPRHKGASLAQAARRRFPRPAEKRRLQARQMRPPNRTRVRIPMLLSKGQALLDRDQAEQALACFDQVLALDSNHPEALVKKGAALERLRKLDEAIACYDQAIVADGSKTVAYLYKGGLFNRLERFSEALECYEQALRTQENRRG
jgi:tetratricopeptide (TPR) repeat protein